MSEMGKESVANADLTSRASFLMMRQTWCRLTVTPDLSSDAFILREP